MSTENCWWEGSSQSRYKELKEKALNNNECKGCSVTRKSALEAAVQKYPSVEKEVPKIMNAWCYVHTAGQGDKSTYCNLFYYWLGEILFRELKSDASVRREVMKNIYEKLQIWKNIDNCTKTFPNVTPEEFGRLRALYYYTQDYNELERRIRTEGEPCGEEYRNFLKEANDTYRDRDWNNRCKGPNNRGSEYCTKIQEILRNADRTLKDPSEILSELKGRLTPLESEKLKDATVETSSDQGKEETNTRRNSTSSTTKTAPEGTTSEGTTSEGTTSEGTTPSAPEPEGIKPAETATPAPVEKFPAKAPESSLNGRGDSSSHHNGAKPPFLEPEVQTTQLAVTETWTSEQSSNTAVDLSIDVTEGITIPTTPILFATWVVTVFISIALLLCKYTSLFRGKKKKSPKSKRRKRRSTIEDELNTSLACSDSATEYSKEGSSIVSSTTVDDSAAEDHSMENDVMEDDSCSSLYSTSS
ncbi:KIR-like protein [Plasmodium coatneyi]|uniref:KIR-like protein n=1 Tax=Plasmodium coatneyi TaxID=208452 RepID=A0A1B1E4F4_9APIC|nr:KIR-like protein [Plasmodium coatneyi]ANQ09669.1 KIR-like protein [Plasmodium coatneyi]